MTTDEVRLLMARLSSLEADLDRRLGQLEDDIEAQDERLDRVLAATEQLLALERDKAKAKGQRMERCIGILETAVKAFTGDAVVRRLFVAAILIAALGFAGITAVSYQDGRLTVGTGPSPETVNKLRADDAPSLPAAPQPLP